MTSDADLRARLDACVHCGLCLPACPTYDLTGDELDSPRGRIDLVRGLLEGTLAGGSPSVAADHLDRCLGCRACETACPSGVRYGEILESGRARIFARRPPTGTASAALATFASPAATLWSMRAVWLARRTGVLAVLRACGGSIGAAARLAPDATWTPWSRTVPAARGSGSRATGTVPAARGSGSPATGTTDASRGSGSRTTGTTHATVAAVPPRRGTVALLPGCVMDQGFGGVHAASAALLSAAGFDVLVPRGPLCCGALHAHVGDAATAGAAAARLADAIPAGLDALIVDAAGCGSHLKETPGPWSGRVFDVLEFLDREGLRAPLGPVAARYGRAAGERIRVAYSDPCHLAHGQGIRDAPRRLLASVPDADLVPLRDADRCCGSAGVFNLAQPGMAAALLAEKVASLREAAPHVVATANPGCHLQIAAGLRRAGLGAPVVHVVELLATALVAGSGAIAPDAAR